MNFKCLLLIAALVVRASDAKSDCDEFLKCLANVLRDFYGSDRNETDIISNKEDIGDVTSVNEQKQNVSISVFDLTDLQKSLSQILTDATSVIKDEIEGKLKIVSESELMKTSNNNTEIHVKVFDLGKINEDTLNFEDSAVGKVKPEVFVNPIDTGLGSESILHNKENSKDFSVSDAGTVFQNINFVNHLPIDQNKSNANIANEANPIQQFQLDKILPSQEEIQNFLDKLIANNNDTEINLEPFHVDIFPEFDLQKDTVSNKTHTLENNVTAPNLPDLLLDSIDKILNIGTDDANHALKSVEYVPENIVHNIDFKQKSISDQHQTTIDVTKAFVIQITNNTNVNLNAFENVQENEIPNTDLQDFEQYYEDNTTDDDNATDYPVIDYIELYKDTTNEDIEFKPTEIPIDKNIRTEGSKADLNNVIEYFEAKEEVLRNEDNANYTHLTNDVSEVFPWIATIFVKNGSSNQFDYFCDGAIVSEKAIVTAARCVNPSAAAEPDAGNFLIIVGKTSLQATRAGDRVHRVKQIHIHENYTTSENEMANDLAILLLEEPIVLSNSIQLAQLLSEELEGTEEAFTTGWEFSGNLTGIHFEKEKSLNCKKNTQTDNVFCATYGNVALCPSYGGLYLIRQKDQWLLQGLRTGDPTTRTFCIDKTVLYTSLLSYVRWIDENIV